MEARLVEARLVEARLVEARLGCIFRGCPRTTALPNNVPWWMGWNL